MGEKKTQYITVCSGDRDSLCMGTAENNRNGESDHPHPIVLIKKC